MIETAMVRNPSSKQTEIKDINETTNQYVKPDENSNRFVTFKANIAATANLRRSSPIPGPP